MSSDAIESSRHSVHHISAAANEWIKERSQAIQRVRGLILISIVLKY
jgi:hypothetical protein